MPFTMDFVPHPQNLQFIQAYTHYRRWVHRRIGTVALYVLEQEQAGRPLHEKQKQERSKNKIGGFMADRAKTKAAVPILRPHGPAWRWSQRCIQAPHSPDNKDVASYPWEGWPHDHETKHRHACDTGACSEVGCDSQICGNRLNLPKLGLWLQGMSQFDCENCAWSLSRYDRSSQARSYAFACRCSCMVPHCWWLWEEVEYASLLGSYSSPFCSYKLQVPVCGYWKRRKCRRPRSSITVTSRHI